MVLELHGRGRLGHPHGASITCDARSPSRRRRSRGSWPRSCCVRRTCVISTPPSRASLSMRGAWRVGCGLPSRQPTLRIAPPVAARSSSRSSSGKLTPATPRASPTSAHAVAIDARMDGRWRRLRRSVPQPSGRCGRGWCEPAGALSRADLGSSIAPGDGRALSASCATGPGGHPRSHRVGHAGAVAAGGLAPGGRRHGPDRKSAQRVSRSRRIGAYLGWPRAWFIFTTVARTQRLECLRGGYPRGPRVRGGSGDRRAITRRRASGRTCGRWSMVRPTWPCASACLWGARRSGRRRGPAANPVRARACMQVSTSS